MDFMGFDIYGMKDMDRDVVEGDELDNDDGLIFVGVCFFLIYLNILLSWCLIF